MYSTLWRELMEAKLYYLHQALLAYDDEGEERERQEPEPEQEEEQDCWPQARNRVQAARAGSFSQYYNARNLAGFLPGEDEDEDEEEDDDVYGHAHLYEDFIPMNDDDDDEEKEEEEEEEDCYDESRNSGSARGSIYLNTNEDISQLATAPPGPVQMGISSFSDDEGEGSYVLPHHQPPVETNPDTTSHDDIEDFLNLGVEDEAGMVALPSSASSSEQDDKNKSSSNTLPIEKLDLAAAGNADDVKDEVNGDATKETPTVVGEEVADDNDQHHGRGKIKRFSLTRHFLPFSATRKRRNSRAPRDEDSGERQPDDDID